MDSFKHPYVYAVSAYDSSLKHRGKDLLQFEYYYHLFHTEDFYIIYMFTVVIQIKFSCSCRNGKYVTVSEVKSKSSRDCPRYYIILNIDRSKFSFFYLLF